MLMKNMKKYVLIFGCILALSAACNRLDPFSGGYTDDVIGLGISNVQTKGLIADGEGTGLTALDDAYTRIRVFDFMTAGTPSTTVQYIDDVIKWKNAQTDPWDYVNGGPYRWTKTGTHKFFGYLTVAPGGTAFATANAPAWAPDNQKLTVGSLEMTPASTQFDFLYSGIISRTMNNSADDDHSYVKLQFNHLFTALGVALKTADDIDEGVTIVVKKIKFTGLKTTRQAVIDFSDDTDVSCELNAGSSAAFTFTPSSALTLTGTAQTFMDYALLWPQLPADTQTSTSADITDDTIIEITYNVGNANADETVTAKLNEAITQMDAGKKYLLTITMKRTVDMKFELLVDPLVEYFYDGVEGDYFDYLIKF